MLRRQVSDDFTFSALAWGAWRLRDGTHARSPQEILRLVEYLLERGVTTIDHADIYGDYGCEGAFGEALALAPSLRERMEIVTKCDIVLPGNDRPQVRVKHYDTSSRHIITTAERALRLLRTPYIDTLLLHRPDPLMDADEVAEAFVRLREAGKVRHFGVSNFTPSGFDLLQSRLDFALITNQVECSAVENAVLRDGTLEHLQRLRRVAMLWSPLGGLFSRTDARARRVRTALETVARRHETSDIVAVATAWLRRLPGASVIIAGSLRREHLAPMIEGMDLPIDRQDWFEIYEAGLGTPVP